MAMLGGAAVAGQYATNAAIWLQFAALALSAVALYLSLEEEKARACSSASSSAYPSLA
ncbi:hypothetical protein [Naasia aerilata]|uniref:hypothetical protein n=1 Tax=Naasia aerilata TaxID=1162966 RepID=UPI002572FC2B|nr:hypothetical protein [Naasia aerilata]